MTFLFVEALLRGTRKGLEGLGGLRNGAGNTARNELCFIAEWSKARERRVPPESPTPDGLLKLAFR